jgi:hypothetical protein
MQWARMDSQQRRWTHRRIRWKSFDKQSAIESSTDTGKELGWDYLPSWSN